MVTRRTLPLVEALKLVEEYGVPVVEYRVVPPDPEAAARAAAELDGRVALKASGPRIIHKTELGAVVLDLDASEVADAARAMLERLRGMGLEVDALVVQRMAEPGYVEAYVGSLRDPVFDALVAVGYGGVLVELIRDVVFDLAPLSLDEAMEDVESTRVLSKLLHGYRGLGPYDSGCLARVLVAAGKLMAGERRVVELDLNPVLVYRRGCLVVDARVVVEE